MLREGLSSSLFFYTHKQENKMANKNPFEIRADMLQLAKEYMDQQYHMNVQFAEQMMEQGKKSIEDIQGSYKMYSMEDLMEKAKEMYSFVSTRDDKS